MPVPIESIAHRSFEVCPVFIGRSRSKKSRPTVRPLITMKSQPIPHSSLTLTGDLHMTTALHHDLLSPRIEERLRAGELSEAQVDAFREFLDRVDRDLFHHRIIT